MTSHWKILPSELMYLNGAMDMRGMEPFRDKQETTQVVSIYCGEATINEGSDNREKGEMTRFKKWIDFKVFEI